MKIQEIKIKTNTDTYKKVEALATLMGIGIEELSERALDSFLYTVNDYLNHIETHVFPPVIHYD